MAVTEALERCLLKSTPGSPQHWSITVVSRGCGLHFGNRRRGEIPGAGTCFSFHFSIQAKKPELNSPPVLSKGSFIHPTIHHHHHHRVGVTGDCQSFSGSSHDGLPLATVFLQDVEELATQA